MSDDKPTWLDRMAKEIDDSDDVVELVKATAEAYAEMKCVRLKWSC